MAYIVIDTETTNTFDDPMVYDCGWSVLDDDFNVLIERSFVVADVFIHEKELMKEAYFADKIPQYVADIADGKRVLKRFYNIRKILREDCKRYNVTAIIAHNARFDYRALQCTQRWLTKSKQRYFLPYGVEVWDTLKMSRQTFGQSESYKNFCVENGFTLADGYSPRFTAEILYRYITNDLNFEESHTGLEDTQIEREIFKRCLEMNPEIEKKLWAN